MQDFVAKLPDFLKPWGEEMLLRYVDFQGTTDRKKFWTVILTNVIIFAILAIIPFVGWFLLVLVDLALLVPSIAMYVRRLRDTGKHWAYLFLALIPLVGFIILIVFFCQE